uniref:P22 n=1 Tax=Olivavirus actinidiae TaxID=2024724 RepID=A0A7L9CC81_9CLOS|nr:P22 [Actinidia virus 1]
MTMESEIMVTERQLLLERLSAVVVDNAKDIIRIVDELTTPDPSVSHSAYYKILHFASHDVVNKVVNNHLRESQLDLLVGKRIEMISEYQVTRCLVTALEPSRYMAFGSATLYEDMMRLNGNDWTAAIANDEIFGTMKDSEYFKSKFKHLLKMVRERHRVCLAKYYLNSPFRELLEKKALRKEWLRAESSVM